MRLTEDKRREILNLVEDAAATVCREHKDWGYSIGTLIRRSRLIRVVFMGNVYHRQATGEANQKRRKVYSVSVKIEPTDLDSALRHMRPRTWEV